MTESFFQKIYQHMLDNDDALIRVFLDDDGDVQFELVCCPDELEDEK